MHNGIDRPAALNKAFEFVYKSETDGDVQGAISTYQDHLDDTGKSVLRSGFNSKLISFRVLHPLSTVGELSISYGDSLSLEIDTSHIKDDFLLRVLLRDSSGALVSDWNSRRSGHTMKKGTQRVIVDLGVIELNPGAYSLSIQIMDQSCVRHICVSEGVGFRVKGVRLFENPIQRTARLVVED
jgi:lipopolysaccharide transport system ATP-binding protein